MTDTKKARQFSNAIPPKAKQKPALTTWHGITLSDAYSWLRAENWQVVLRNPAKLPAPLRRLIESENSFADTVMSQTNGLQKRLMKELRGRIEEDDTDVPVPDGPYAYYTRFREGGQHPLYCRGPRNGGPETILIDGDHLARGKAFFDLSDGHHAPDHSLMWWSADTQGSEFHDIHIRNLETLTDLDDVLHQTDGQAVWNTASDALYYVRIDDNHRPMQVWRHRIGTPAANDHLIYEEHDPAWFISLHRSCEGKHAILTIKDHDSTECHLIDLRNDFAAPILIAPRKPGLRYEAEPQGDRLFICTNAEGAEDFKIVTLPLNTAGTATGQELVGHRPGCLIVATTLRRDFLVRLERENSLPRIVIRDLATGIEHQISFPEDAYALHLDELEEFDSSTLRFTYSSMTTPEETYDYDMRDHSRILRKRQIIPSGHNPADYVTRRIFATAPDGADVPVTLLHRRGFTFPAPVLLYGYGAYGHALSAGFSSNRLPLVDRGFVYAIAHVRGGTDKGWNWYKSGKLEHKTNTFTDFIACAHHLIAENITRKGQIVAQGGSAGGMLMGAITNMAPELFAGIVADVPFVDVLNTMLDDTLPLTPPEWLEWGNPIADEAAFRRMLAYSPYDNVAARDYPPVLALAGLTDPRVTYWEPLKWVQKLRAVMTGGGPILLKTNMDAGHAGAAGRFDQLEEIALIQAFALTACGVAEED